MRKKRRKMVRLIGGRLKKIIPREKLIARVWPPYANIRRLIILKNGVRLEMFLASRKFPGFLRNFRANSRFLLIRSLEAFSWALGDLISTEYSTTLTDPTCAYVDEICRVYIYGLGKSRVWLPTGFKLQIDVQRN